MKYTFADSPEVKQKIRELLDTPIEPQVRINRPKAPAAESLRPWAVKPVARTSKARIAQQRLEHAMEGGNSRA